MTNKYRELIHSHKDWEMYIDGELTTLGMPQDLLGYYYLIAGIILSAEDISLAVNSITKRLYPTIADICNTTPIRVERCIRHAIERTNSYKLFGDPDKKPTNSAFIACMANRIRRKF